MKPQDVLKTFTEGSCEEMVVLKDIEFYSTCEHHLQPFFGTISIGYLPKGRVLGISKLARLVEVFARRLQIQEKLVAQIADSLMETLQPHGVMVVCKAKHMCISSRGIEKHNAVMVTSAIRGAFLTSAANPPAPMQRRYRRRKNSAACCPLSRPYAKNGPKFPFRSTPSKYQ